RKTKMSIHPRRFSVSRFPLGACLLPRCTLLLGALLLGCLPDPKIQVPDSALGCDPAHGRCASVDMVMPSTDLRMPQVGTGHHHIDRRAPAVRRITAESGIRHLDFGIGQAAKEKGPQKESAPRKQTSAKGKSRNGEAPWMDAHFRLS